MVADLKKYQVEVLLVLLSDGSLSRRLYSRVCCRWDASILENSVGPLVDVRLIAVRRCVRSGHVLPFFRLSWNGDFKQIHLDIKR